MEEHAIVYRQSYSQFKTELDYELNKAAQGFVRIGYLLKQARDTDVLKDSPYQNVVEFAKAEYNLDKTTVSRFISIHDRFGDPKDPEQLQEKYRNFGIKKLAMMLTLPDKLNEELTDDFTAAEIQTIKEEVDEEKKITPIEVMTEEAPKAQEDLSVLAKVLYQVGENEPEIMEKLMETDYLTVNTTDQMILGVLAPAGQKMYMARVPAVGKYALNINGDRVSLVDIRNNKTEQHTAEDISSALNELYDMAWGKDGGPETAKKMWESVYMKEFPEVKEAAVAPVQQKKESKVSVSKSKAEKKPEKKEEKKTEKKAVEKAEKQKESQPKQTDTEIKETQEEEEAPKTRREQITGEEDRYEYFEPETTIEGLVELLEDYEKAIEKEKKVNGKEPMYVSIDIDGGFAASIYNAIKELQHMKKIGGHRR